MRGDLLHRERDRLLAAGGAHGVFAARADDEEVAQVGRLLPVDRLAVAERPAVGDVVDGAAPDHDAAQRQRAESRDRPRHREVAPDRRVAVGPDALRLRHPADANRRGLQPPRGREVAARPEGVGGDGRPRHRHQLLPRQDLRLGGAHREPHVERRSGVAREDRGEPVRGHARDRRAGSVEERDVEEPRVVEQHRDRDAPERRAARRGVVDPERDLVAALRQHGALRVAQDPLVDEPRHGRLRRGGRRPGELLEHGLAVRGRPVSGAEP